MALRQRVTKIINIKHVKTLDAFPKLEAECQEGSPISGAVSILTYFIMLWLIISETSYYLNANINYKFLPDTDYDAKLPVNIDLTVAMPCPTVGADILDSTGQNIIQFGFLHEEDTWFELDSEQRAHFQQIQSVNSYLSHRYLLIHEFLWTSPQEPFHSLPARKTTPDRPHDACRIYGQLVLNKVAGNFHITAGKSLQLPRGHIHVSAFMSERDYNFSHRIDHFSFGEPTNGVVRPLEGDEKIARQGMMLYQYFLEVVATEVETLLSQQNTFQYSTKDQSREISHMSGSHGIPGIFFKYDMSALKVRVLQERDSLAHLLIKLCALIGGVHVTFGILSNFIRLITCRIHLFGQEKSRPLQSNPTSTLVGR